MTELHPFAPMIQPLGRAPDMEAAQAAAEDMWRQRGRERRLAAA